MKNQSSNPNSQWGTIIIGAGQAGLSAGYYLSKTNENFIIIDSVNKIGDSWRNRWDSLHLFTPSQYDGLPGHPFPASRGYLPSKDEIADYIEKYATDFHLPVRLNEKALRLSRNEKGFEVVTSKGVHISNNVIVSTGTNPLPRVPNFAGELDKNIYQIHSSQYLNPDSLPSGDVLVVGAGTSGLEIAIELSKSRHTLISGHPTFHIPDQVFRYAGSLYWWFANNILTISTPIGRKARVAITSKGGPLISVSVTDLVRAGVEQVPRVRGIENGMPKLEDGRIVKINSVIWATGFRPDFSWIELDIPFDKSGWPVTKRGISSDESGLYFTGMLFQYGLTSGLIGGVGRDSAFVVKHLRKNRNGRSG